ncbi:MAG: N-acetyltransferase [Sphaerochaetaceae bacterium]|nr:N-acetyltransferase [Sphaerochaetaceae bacterium]MDC7248758.1 N-acetyltransferase [Sphaerochaetaceae bacterium]
MEIRELTIDDLRSYKQIRLEGLKNNPTFFGSSYSEETKLSTQQWQERLKKQPNKLNLGLFYDNKLVSIISLIQETKEKRKHCGTIFSVMTKEKYQHKGLASILLGDLITRVDNSKKITILTLKVGSSNYNAQKLYKKFGFVEIGTEVDSIKYKDNYYSMKIFQRVNH